LPAWSGDPFGRLTVKNVRAGKSLALEERCWQRPRTLSGLFHNAESIRSLPMRDILPHFRNNKDGLIINISSGAGVAETGTTAIGTKKANLSDVNVIVMVASACSR
jgi:hypothetical protein